MQAFVLSRRPKAQQDSAPPMSDTHLHRQPVGYTHPWALPTHGPVRCAARPRFGAPLKTEFFVKKKGFCAVSSADGIIPAGAPMALASNSCEKKKIVTN